MAFLNSFKRSLAELRSIRCLTVVGVFIAIYVVLDGFATIRIGEFLKIDFAYLALAMIGMLFGPAVGFIAGFACDLVGYLVNPIGGFIPWFALITALEGFIYGLGLYNFKPEKDVRQYLRVALTRGVVTVICNLFLKIIKIYGIYTVCFYQVRHNEISVVIFYRIQKRIVYWSGDDHSIPWICHKLNDPVKS